MNPYNPMMDYQRNSLMAQQNMLQNQLNQQYQQYQRPTFNPYPQPQQPQYFIKQVGSVEEAKGFPIDPNVIYLFPDTGTGRIYLKKLNTENGRSEIYIYNPSQETEDTVVAKDDPMEGIGRRLDAIDERIGGLYESISRLATDRGGHEESDGRNATAVAPKDEKPRPQKVRGDIADDKGKG